MADTIDYDKLEKDVQKLFDMYDKEKTGKISTDKIKDIIENLGQNLKEDELKSLIKSVDKEKKGEVDFEDMFPVLAGKIVEKKEMDELKNYFRILDKERNGFIERSAMEYLLRGIQEACDPPMTEPEIQEAINEIDEDGNGEISFEEFYKLMKGGDDQEQEEI